MPSCNAYGCSHDSRKDKCRYFRFPKDAKVRKKWIKACRRSDKEPNEYSRLCSCHFTDGNNKNLPAIFIFNKDKHFNFPKLDERKHKFIGESNSPPSKKSKLVPNNRPISIDDSSSNVLKEVNQNFIEVLSNQSIEELPDVDLDADNSCNPGMAITPKAKDLKFNPAFSEPSNKRIKNVYSNSQVQSLISENELLKSQLVKCKTENIILQDRLQHHQSACVYGHDLMTEIRKKEKFIISYTGLPSLKVFDILLQYILRFKFSYSEKWTVIKVSTENQLLMTLMKLRCNFTYADLAFRFNVSMSTVKNILSTWIFALHKFLFVGLIQDMPVPSSSKNSTSMPVSFNHFKNCRMIIDCTEYECGVVRKNMRHRRKLFSHYKQRPTHKALIGIAPNGLITFVSDMYPGCTSDRQIVIHSNIMSVFEPGDTILADKGFLIHDLLPQGVTLNIPPFCHNGKFTKDEIIRTTRIARARIHVERAIERIKLFKILDFVPNHTLKYFTIIFQVCAGLVNFQTPLIKDLHKL